MDPITEQRRRGADRIFPRLLGGRLCLDFVNTIESPLDARAVDSLREYADLVRWSRHAGLLDQAATRRLLKRATHQSAESAGVFERALAPRAALTSIFRAVAHGETPAPDEVELVQLAYLVALTHARLVPGAVCYEWDYRSGPVALEYPRWAVARSALDLLTNGDLRRVKQCPSVNDCGWLFYDASKNGRRQWCSMEGCGSRAKMRRYYARHRATTPSRARRTRSMEPGRTARVASATGAK